MVVDKLIINVNWDHKTRGFPVRRQCFNKVNHIKGDAERELLRNNARDAELFPCLRSFKGKRIRNRTGNCCRQVTDSLKDIRQGGVACHRDICCIPQFQAAGPYRLPDILQCPGRVRIRQGRHIRGRKVSAGGE